MKKIITLAFVALFVYVMATNQNVRTQVLSAAYGIGKSGILFIYDTCSNQIKDENSVVRSSIKKLSGI